ncbi:peptidyl-prolyl cis-trans isomerase [Aneurinibacillus sp. Ricciae_BoGa-3]|uniref:peptidyl-prolyl cis-trans isomerase n=1 Tax=Aneurinibacillus sp. Ricciae_BoGa-3 TaxID=3022697 RepID=UPI0023405696|nr:peptidyl-prolyl cis-trans isomerase [Aneurinibacillus sp. Ricciae_BoGa-3]WCK53368.1 peptidyl-prolyl cis-trans isomerase [Aneurinibacillus sp. Ricciae_BoGa-3]
MSDIITISGKVKYAITLDPSVWIFDDRNFKMEDFFARIGEEQQDEEDRSLEAIGRQWDRELREGVPTKQTEKLFAEKKRIAGDYGIAFAPFLKNAEPEAGSSMVICKHPDGAETKLSLDDAGSAILCFAIDGKPIRGEEGPVQLFFGDGRNMNDPIKSIRSFIIE